MEERTVRAYVGRPAACVPHTHTHTHQRLSVASHDQCGDITSCRVESSDSRGPGGVSLHALCCSYNTLHPGRVTREQQGLNKSEPTSNLGRQTWMLNSDCLALHPSQFGEWRLLQLLCCCEFGLLVLLEQSDKNNSRFKLLTKTDTAGSICKFVKHVLMIQILKCQNLSSTCSKQQF